MLSHRRINAAVRQYCMAQVDFNPDMSTARIESVILGAGAKMDLIDRGVYVIRMKAPFGIAYPKGHSPTLYLRCGFK